VVLAHQRPGAGGGALLADQDGGAELVPGGGELVLADAGQGGVTGKGGTGQALHLPQRIGGLPGPAPLAGRRGADHGPKLPQGVRVAQRVPGHAGVGVIRGPGVMHRDAGEPGEHSGGIHPLGAASSMDRDQREPPG
jgi:hypothetical protein